MMTSAPSNSSVHFPRVSASHETVRHFADAGLRLSTTTSWPSLINRRARTVPTCPEPPGMMIFISASRDNSGDVGTRPHQTHQCNDQSHSRIKRVPSYHHFNDSTTLTLFVSRGTPSN